MLDVLVVDDDFIVRESIADALRLAGHRVTQAADGEEALTAVASHPFDLALCDVQMPRLDGLALFRRLRRDAPNTAVVLMTTFGKIPDAVGTLRDGAVDYVTKPFDPDDFVRDVVGPIAERRGLMRSLAEARARFVGREAGGALVGASLAMRQLAERVAVAATSDAAVLIAGESGVGKKLVARTLHAASPRRGGPLLVVPCASLPDRMRASELRELSELRARNHRDEWFRAAEGGTVVLDGVDVLPASAQSALLRVLDEPTTRARRSRDWQPLGVRVISITRTSVAELLPRGLMLDALFYRLSGVQLSVPPLRERDGDLYLLTNHILRELTPPGRGAAFLTPRAWKALTVHPFAGNIRELSWALEHAVAAANGGDVDLEHLPAAVAQRDPAFGALSPRAGPPEADLVKV